MSPCRRTLATLLVVAMFFTSGLPASAAAVDVTGTLYEEAVNYLMDLGVVAGYPDGTFRPEATITRAEAAKILVVMTYGDTTMADLLRGAAPYSDVPGTHWASGFIALVRNSGLVTGYPDGTYRPAAPVTYAEWATMMCRTAGLPPLPGLLWPSNYIGAALNAGMLSGVVSFEANAPATRGNCAIMAAYTVLEIPNPTTGKTIAQTVFGESLVTSLALSPTETTVAIGAAVQFTATTKDAGGAVVTGVPVTYRTDNAAASAVNDAGLFVASTSGHYTVTAVVGDLSASATVHVFGAAVALRATPATATIPANGETKVAILVEVIDASGVRVLADDKTEVTVEYAEDGANGAVQLPDETAAVVKDGATTLEFVATTNSDVTDLLRFYVALDEDIEDATAEIGAVDQIPTAIQLEADPEELLANEIDYGTVTATVLDQAGEPMLSGAYELTFSVIGQGTIDGSTANISLTTLAGVVAVPVESVKGDPGTLTITCTGQGIASASLTLNTYIAGSPVALKAVVDEGRAQAGEDDLVVTVGLIDRWGHWTIADTDTLLEFDYDEEEARFSDSFAGLTIPAGEPRTAAIEFAGLDAGTWTISVTDAGDAYTMATFEVAVTAGEPHAIVLTPDLDDYEMYVPLDSPVLSVTAQVQDEYGNNVPEAGLELQFTAMDHPALTLLAAANSGGWEATGDGEVKTDGSGKATCVFTFDPYVGDRWWIAVESSGDEWEASAATANPLVVTDTIPGKMTIVTESVDYGGADITSIAADDTQWVYVTVTVEDTNGNELTSPTLVEMTFSNDGENVQDLELRFGEDWFDADADEGRYVGYTQELAGGGQLQFRFLGAKAGSFTITARALQTSTTVTAAKSFRTKAGLVVDHVLVLRPDGSLADAIDVKADTPVVLKLSPVDHGGNPMVAPVDVWAILGPEHGEYRLTASGTAVEEVTIGAGRTYETIYFAPVEDWDDLDLHDDVLDWGLGEMPPG